MARRNEGSRNVCGQLTKRSLARAIESLEQRRMCAADLVISEFLASNNSGLVDAYGERSDWIEIHNRGNEAANLGSYFLTDTLSKPMQWKFPEQQLAAGGYLVVFASDRNLAVANQQLHTNFKLSADGEYLGLMRSDGTAQSEYAPKFPAQSSNISYGLTNENDPASAAQLFATPTPGAGNLPSAVAPTFAVPAKVFQNFVTVPLSSTTPGAQIYYTFNRTTPTQQSLLYTGPITVSLTTTITARVFAPNVLPSQINSQTYVRINSELANVSNNIGTVVIDTFGQPLNDTSYVLGSGTFIGNTNGGRSRFSDTADYSGRIGVRVRGSTSQNFPKKSLAVELWDQANEDTDAALLGMPKESDWILYGAYSEKSLLQNALAFGWGTEAGLLAPRFHFVEVYLSTDGGVEVNASSDYVGLYILMEKIKISESRVDIADLGPGDNAEPDITGGYLWKKDRIEPDEQVVTTNSGQPFVMVDPEKLTTQQTTWFTNYLNEFEGALNGSNYRDPVNGYAKFIDVDNWVDTYLVAEMTKNIDAYRLSSFYYKDKGGKIKMGPMWDYNLSLGNAWYFDGREPTGFYTDQWNDFDIPYVRRLMTDPAFKQKVVDRWAVLRQTMFSTPNLLANVDARVADLADGTTNYPVGTYPAQSSTNALVRNFQRWNVLGVYNWPNSFYDRAGKWIEDVNMMKDWIAARVNWMDTQLLPAPVASQPSGNVTGPIAVTLTPRRVVNTETSLISATSPVKAIIPTGDLPGWNERGFNTSGWLSGNGAVGYDTTPSPVNYNPLLVGGINVGSMQNNSLGVYTRYEFNVADPGAIDALILKLRYDDGIVVYLNGVRVLSDNDEASADIFGDPNLTRWNNFALVARDDAVAINRREFDLSAVKRLLVAGTNVLAIQAMNNAASSTDLLVLPELVSRTRLATSTAAGTQVWYTRDGSDPLLADGVARNPAALLYTGAVNVDATTTLKFRSLTGTSWSGIDSRAYIVAPIVPPAVISSSFLYEVAPNQVAIHFSKNVLPSLSVGDLTLVNRTTPQAALPITMSYDAATNTATFTFGSGAMADGDYRLTLNADGITDGTGTKLDGDANGTAGGDLVFDFFSMAGDVNHDRNVNFDDLVFLAQNYNKTGLTFAQGNLDYSAGGEVNFDDLVILSQRYNATLALPTVIAPALVAPTKATSIKTKAPAARLTELA